MQVSIENTSSLGRKMTIDIPVSDIKQEQELKLKDLQGKVKFDGFRSGKVPSKLISQKFGKQIFEEAVATMLEKSLTETIKEKEINIVGQPNIEAVQKEQGKDAKYVVNFEVFPSIEIKPFEELELDKPTATISEEDIDKGIERLKEQFASWVEVDREAKNGDKLTIDFVGYIDSEVFDNGSGENIELELGSNKFIPGFEEGLIGAKVNQELDLNVTFPSEYNAKELAGKDALFKTTVKKIEEKALSEINEDFAKKIGIEDGDVAKVRDKIKSNMEQYLEEKINELLVEASYEALYLANPIEVPDILVKQELSNMLENAKRENANQEISDDKQAELKEEAKKKTCIGLLINEVIKVNDIKLDNDKLNAKISQYGSMFGDIQFAYKLYSENKEMMANLQFSVLTEQAAQLIVDKAKMNEKPSTFEDIASGS